VIIAKTRLSVLEKWELSSSLSSLEKSSRKLISLDSINKIYYSIGEYYMA
jgi:hypothetical protein